MDASDERLMEHTEKVVADMLKYVLAPNEMRTEDSVEFVIIDETGGAKANNAGGLETTDEQTYTFDLPGIKMTNPANDNALNEVLSDIELFLAQGLDKIRTEYPMYAESTNPYLCNNCFANGMQPPTSGGYNFVSNAQAPLNNNWFASSNAGSGSFSSTFGNAYPNNVTTRAQNCIGELWNDEDEWPVVGNLPKRNKRVANEPNADIEKDIMNGGDSSGQEEEESDDNSNASATPAAVHGHIQQQNVAATNQQYAEYSAAHSSPAATTAANPFQLSQTALHQTHSTTTTTTAFGVVHQQTSSSTTTNFVSNNLANAALATSPAALYTQALLAQQYWSTILKDAQQRQHNNNLQASQQNTNNTNNNHNNNNNNNLNTSNNQNHNNNNNNINAAIYERFAYAHLLQQQIIQQQQQAAIAALLQQQKIALQNNIAAAAAAQAANTNLFAQAANVMGPSCGNTNNFANFSLNSHDYGRNPNSTSSLATQPQAATTATMNLNMHLNTNLFANDATVKNDIPSYNNNNSSSTNNNNNRHSHNCTPTNSNISIDLLNLNVADHEEHPVACQGIVSKILQSSHE